MIKISANLSKKVPLPNVGYSSQQYGASIEIEVGDADSADAIHERMRRLYCLLNRAVDEQISTAGKAGGNGRPEGAAAARPETRPPAAPPGPAPRAGRVVPATKAQVRAIQVISSERGMDLHAALAPFRVSEPEQLTVRQASQLIDGLKAKNGNGA